MIKTNSQSEENIEYAAMRICDELLEYLSQSKSQYPVLLNEDLEAIVRKNNDGNVLNELSYFDSHALLDTLLSKRNITHDIHKVSFIKNNFTKGLRNLDKKKINLIKTFSSSRDVSMPVLKTKALKYRYNNDKESYDFR